jgi:hypothetical protein
LVRETFYFWTSRRFLDGGLRLEGGKSIGWDGCGLPYGLLSQFQGLCMNDVLPKYRQRIVHLLEEKKGESNKGKNWLEVFFAVFIVLHSLEMNVQHERDHAQRQNSAVNMAPLLDLTISLTL